MTLRCLALLCVLLPGGACASVSGPRYVPPTQAGELRAGEELRARISVAWRGARPTEEGCELCFRVTLANPGPDAFVLAPARFELFDVLLEPVGEARVDGLPAAVRAAGEETFEVAFPVAARAAFRAELGALELRVELAGSRWTWVTRFRRVEDEAAPSALVDPWYGTPWAVRGSVAGRPDRP